MIDDHPLLSHDIVRAVWTFDAVPDQFELSLIMSASAFTHLTHIMVLLLFFLPLSYICTLNRPERRRLAPLIPSQIELLKLSVLILILILILIYFLGSGWQALNRITRNKSSGASLFTHLPSLSLFIQLQRHTTDSNGSEKNQVLPRCILHIKDQSIPQSHHYSSTSGKHQI